MKKVLLKKKQIVNFIERAKAVHGEKNDYSLVRYRGALKPVTIICKKHGNYLQTPANHLSGKGCPYCAGNRLTRDEFLETVRVLYGNVYEYSRCAYTHKSGKSEHITVTCKVHGDFIVKVDDHLKGIGCPRCARIEKQKLKLEVKQPSLPESQNKVTKVTYVGAIRFITKNPQIPAYVWSGTFETKPEAEEFIEDWKLCIEMSESVVIEATIVEKRQQFLDSESAAKLFKWLNLDSNVAYIRWWDLCQPNFLPRNLPDYYQNVDKMFSCTETEIVLSIINRIRQSDNDEKQRA